MPATLMSVLRSTCRWKNAFCFESNVGLRMSPALLCSFGSTCFLTFPLIEILPLQLLPSTSSLGQLVFAPGTSVLQ